MAEYSDYNDFDDNFEEEEWDEERWEKYFQKEDEQKRKLEELLDKYGYSEQGLMKAFEEMGYDIEEGDDISDFDPLEDENEDSLEEYLEEQYSDWDPETSSKENLEQAHPLFQDCYGLILKIMKMLRHVDIRYREHPVITFQSGLFECMSKLIRAGYDDIDFNLEAERGLLLAALKRSRKALFLSLLTIPKMDNINIISFTTQNLFRHEITGLLKLINREIIHLKNKKN